MATVRKIAILRTHEYGKVKPKLGEYLQFYDMASNDIIQFHVYVKWDENKYAYP